MTNLPLGMTDEEFQAGVEILTACGITDDDGDATQSLRLLLEWTEQGGATQFATWPLVGRLLEDIQANTGQLELNGVTLPVDAQRAARVLIVKQREQAEPAHIDGTVAAVIRAMQGRSFTREQANYIKTVLNSRIRR